MEQDVKTTRLNPWLHIWIKPRAVMRQELEKPNREKNFILLAVLIGIPIMFTSYESFEIDVNVGLIFGISLIGGPLLSLAVLYISSWIYAVVGRWIGGNGRAADLRVATIRGWIIPSIVPSVISIIDYLIRGEEYFISREALTEPGEYVGFIDSISNGMTPLLIIPFFMFNVWVFVIWLKASGEAHHFSAWKSLLTTLILGGMIFIIAMFGILLFTAIAVF